MTILQQAALLLFPLCVATASSSRMSMDSSWYKGLKKPSWTPPGWLFAPVWIVLYVLMGLALRRLYMLKKLSPAVFLLFAVQLALNALWSPVFFGLKKPGAALGIVAALDALVVALIVVFWRLDARAGWLLVSYASWLVFATVLNWSIVRGQKKNVEIS